MLLMLVLLLKGFQFSLAQTLTSSFVVPIIHITLGTVLTFVTCNMLGRLVNLGVSFIIVIRTDLVYLGCTVVADTDMVFDIGREYDLGDTLYSSSRFILTRAFG